MSYTRYSNARPEPWEGKSIYHAPGEHAKAPWFLPQGVRSEFINRFVSSNGMLPGGIPVSALRSWEWRRRILVANDEIAQRPRWWKDGRWGKPNRRRATRRDIVIAVADKLRIMSGPLLPGSLTFDLWCYRTIKEVGYVQAMHALRATVQSWTELGVNADVHVDAIMWPEAMSLSNYRTIKKAGDQYWGDLVRLERRSRSEYGYFLLWHNVESHSVNPLAFRDRYVPVPSWWRDWEVPPGLWSEMGPAMAYIGRTLIAEPNSGWWVVVCTGYVLGVVFSWVWDAYDTYRLWRLPLRVRDAIDRLQGEAFCIAVGANVCEDLARFLPVHNSIRWNTVDVRNRNRPTLTRDYSPFECPGGGDYVYFDPFEAVVITAQDARRRRRGTLDDDGRPTQRPRVEAYRPRTFADVQQQPRGSSSQGVNILSDQVLASAPSETHAGTAHSSVRPTNAPPTTAASSVPPYQPCNKTPVRSPSPVPTGRGDDQVPEPSVPPSVPLEAPKAQTGSSERKRAHRPRRDSPVRSRQEQASRRAMAEAHFSLVDQEERDGFITISDEEGSSQPKAAVLEGSIPQGSSETPAQPEANTVRPPSPLSPQPFASSSPPAVEPAVEFSFDGPPSPDLRLSPSPEDDVPIEPHIKPFEYSDVAPILPSVESADPEDPHARLVDIRGSTHTAPRYGPTQYSEEAFKVVETFVGSIIDVGSDGLGEDAQALTVQLRGYIREVRQALRQGNPVVVGNSSQPVRLLPIPKVGEVNPLLRGRNALRVLHHFLSGIATPSETGLALTIRGLFQQVGSYLRSLRPRGCFTGSSSQIPPA